MEHEFKIIMKVHEGQPAKTSNVMVYLDNQPVGLIQNIKFEANSESLMPTLELTFPNLESDKVDQSYKKSSNNLIGTLKHYKELFTNFPSIKVILKELF
jgi:hypothetical protein